MVTVPTLLLIPYSTFADEVYKWTDNKGVVHFGNNPTDIRAEKAALPEIQKENFDKKLGKIKEETPKNCINRGGVDCSKGADADGSVVCYDGYREALLPFRFTCVEARLSINTVQIILNPEHPETSIISPIKDLNLHPKISLKGAQLSILVRNETEVSANKMAVTFKTPRHGYLVGNGPASIEPLGVAEYTLSLKELIGPFTITDLRELSAAVRCENCNKAIRYNQ